MSPRAPQRLCHSHHPVEAPGQQLPAPPQRPPHAQGLVSGTHGALRGKGHCQSLCQAQGTASSLPRAPGTHTPTLAALQSATTSTLGTNFGNSSAAGKTRRGRGVLSPSWWLWAAPTLQINPVGTQDFSLGAGGSVQPSKGFWERGWRQEFPAKPRVVRGRGAAAHGRGKLSLESPGPGGLGAGIGNWHRELAPGLGIGTGNWHQGWELALGTSTPPAGTGVTTGNGDWHNLVMGKVTSLVNWELHWELGARPNTAQAPRTGIVQEMGPSPITGKWEIPEDNNWNKSLFQEPPSCRDPSPTSPTHGLCTGPPPRPRAALRCSAKSGGCSLWFCRNSELADWDPAHTDVLQKNTPDGEGLYLSV